MSVNSLVSRNLRRLVEWDAYAEKFGFVTIPAALFTRVLELLSDEQAAQLGRWAGTNIVREYITFWFKEINLETVRKGLFGLASRYEKAFEYEERIGNEESVVVIYHAGGPRSSVYYGEMVRALLEELLHLETVIERTDNQVIVRFHERAALAPEQATIA